MKKSGIINPKLIRCLAELGHFDSFVICDMGFPIPKHAERIDLSLLVFYFCIFIVLFYFYIVNIFLIICICFVLKNSVKENSFFHRVFLLFIFNYDLSFISSTTKKNI